VLLFFRDIQVLVIGSGGRGKLFAVLNHQRVCGCLRQRVLGAGLCFLSSALLPARTCLEELFRHVKRHACTCMRVLTRVCCAQSIQFAGSSSSPPNAGPSSACPETPVLPRSLSACPASA